MRQAAIEPASEKVWHPSPITCIEVKCIGILALLESLYQCRYRAHCFARIAGANHKLSR